MKQNLSISDYNYNLPDEKIAKYPVEPRDTSKLLVYKEETIIDERFKNIPAYLPENSLLVYNNTRVIHARLRFSKATGAKIEIFCLDPHDPTDYQISFATKNKVVWKCMVGNLKKWKGETLHREIIWDSTTLNLSAKHLGAEGKNQLIEFSWDGEATFSEIIEACGEIPIPPYLNRESEEKDKQVYQTIYARSEGSVAAPTAGLHFTEEVFSALKAKNIQQEAVTLHVGAGTFQPVKTDDVSNHEMHAEWVSVHQDSIKNLMNHLGNITAVGTTTVRTLESLYWVGVMLAQDPNLNSSDLKVEQWIPYDKNIEHISTKASLQAILSYLKREGTNSVRFFTRIIIVPGYTFRLVNRMVTNFHQPSSTLLLLVSAFIGDNWINIYEHALKNDYRFLSFGDSSLLFPKKA